MALRVLLADESSTIKKAIQLVLAEYGVEIKTVPTGIDVLSVTLSFNPDIVIADVLLNKKNGYDVCSELKSHPATKSIPVLLMWSNFMHLDDELFKKSGADASLEKPFDTDTIKMLIEKLVPKLMGFPMRGLLNHAPLPDFEESDTYVRQKNTISTLVAPEIPDQSNSDTPATFVIDDSFAFGGADPISEPKSSLEPKVSFKEKLAKKQQQLQGQEPEKVPTQTTSSPALRPTPKPAPPQPTGAQPAQGADDWTPAKTRQFVIETENYGDFEEVKVIDSGSQDASESESLNEQIHSYIKDATVTNYKAQNKLNPKNSMSSFDEQLMKEEIRQIAERICWQVIPEITEKIVREELKKLLQGIENNI